MDENTAVMPRDELIDSPAGKPKQIANMDYSDYVALLMESRII